jgi:uncharacterized protein YcfL
MSHTRHLGANLLSGCAQRQEEKTLKLQENVVMEDEKPTQYHPMSLKVFFKKWMEAGH